MDLTTIVENISKPKDLEYLSLNFEDSQIQRQKFQQYFIISFHVNNDINILNLLNWFKYKVKKFSELNSIKSLTLFNWDDTKQYDFERKYELYIMLSIEEYEYVKLKFNNFDDVYNIAAVGTFLLN